MTAAVTPPRQQTGVLAEQIVLRFGDRTVLDRLDLVIDDEELVVLLGPSGCGKSTLLRLLAGLDRPDGGRIEVPAKRAIVFQGDRLLPWQRVLRNVTLGLLFPLFTGTRPRPGSNLFLVVADNSRSLQLADRGPAKSRGAAMKVRISRPATGIPAYSRVTTTRASLRGRAGPRHARMKAR